MRFSIHSDVHSPVRFGHPRHPIFNIDRRQLSSGAAANPALRRAPLTLTLGAVHVHASRDSRLVHTAGCGFGWTIRNAPALPPPLPSPPRPASVRFNRAAPPSRLPDHHACPTITSPTARPAGGGGTGQAPEQMQHTIAARTPCGRGPRASRAQLIESSESSCSL